MNKKLLRILVIMLTLTAKATPATYTSVNFLRNLLEINALKTLQKSLNHNNVNSRNEYGLTLLLYATSINCSFECLTILLQKGADPKVSTPKHQYTALHFAAMCGNKEFIETLIKHGAKVDARDAELMTPLHHAWYNGHAECAKELINHGADTAAKTMWGHTPAELAYCRKD